MGSPSATGDGPAPPPPSGAATDAPLLVRLAEQLADARARLIVVETQLAQRGQADEAYRGQTRAHLDRQDDALLEVARKLDDLLAERAEEARARAELLSQSRLAHQETRRAAATTLRTVLLMLPAGLVSGLATAWSPPIRVAIFATSVALVVGALLFDYIRSMQT